MIGKLAIAGGPKRLILSMLVLTIVLGARGLAQQAPAGQAPATPPAEQQAPAAAPAAQKPDSGQEPAEDESTSRRKRVHDYKNWSYDAGAGANLNSGKTQTYVRGGGFVGTAGVARNANKYLGLRADFIFANLPLRDSTQQLAQATGASNNAYSVTVGPIINVQITKLYGAYILFGPAFTHRSGHLDSDLTVPGSACNAFWTWWGSCTNSSIPLSGDFVHSSLNQFGYDFGVGATRKMPSGVELYAEIRFVHGSGDSTTTDFHPITLGFRW